MRIAYIKIFVFVTLVQLLGQSQHQNNQFLENSNQQKILELRKSCSKDFREKNVMSRSCMLLIQAYGLQVSSSSLVDESIKLSNETIAQISVTCASSAQSSKLSDECSKNIQSIITSFDDIDFFLGKKQLYNPLKKI